MKLSMWMIANRLSSLLDLETNISLDAKPILNSARVVYSTNCVHIYEDKNSVICDAEGDVIRIRGLSIKEAFEIIQGVFDYFQDWESQIQTDIRNQDFQSLIDRCDLLFQNPMILMNANYACLAMSSSYGPEDVDDEWAYISRFGYSSPASIRQMRENQTFNLEKSGYQSYQYESISGIRYGGASYHLHFNQVSCGRLTILAKNRPLNPGDYQLMKKIGDYLEPALSMNDHNTSLGSNALVSLLLGNPYIERELKFQFEYFHWKESDTFQVAVLCPFNKDQYLLNPHQSLIPESDSKHASGKNPIQNPVQNQKTDLDLILHTLQFYIPNTLVTRNHSQIIILSNRNLSEDVHFLDYYRQVLEKEQLHLGFSLPLSGSKEISRLYVQASHALDYGQKYMPSESICHFYTFAVYYIMDTSTVAERLYACHPVVRRLWRDKNLHQDTLYDTLKAYLDCERSLVNTARMLYTHRNTVLYRLKKCASLLTDNLDDPKVRYYIRLSMHYIETVAQSVTPG